MQQHSTVWLLQAAVMEVAFNHDILQYIKRAIKEDIILNHFAYPGLGVTHNNLNGNVLAQPSKRSVDMIQTHLLYYWGHTAWVYHELFIASQLWRH